MPISKSAILRLFWLDRFFNEKDSTGQRKKYKIPELTRMVTAKVAYALDDPELKLSESIIRHDIKYMRDVLKAPIKNKRGYWWYDEEFSLFGPWSEEDIITVYELNDVLSSLPGDLPPKQKLIDLWKRLKNISGWDPEYFFKPFVVLESISEVEGIKWIPKIYEALENNQYLQIDYDSFDGSGDFEDLVRPYLLREYRNRWFLIGKPESVPEDFYTIPLDRIRSVKIIGDYFHPKEKEKIIEKFRHIVGVTYIAENPIEEILLQFRAPAHHYVRTKPLHDSQKILEEYPDGMIVRLRLKVNYELKQLILTYVPNVRVLKPKYLHAEMVEMLREGLRFMEGD
ncbi:MAG: WYL domain-containing protein [Chlorobi bacterium]|nr:WYL domain-containing protein [Chlorobiota bacterium]